MSSKLSCQVPHLPINQPTCRILVADDHPVNRILLMRLLKRSGFSVRQAVDGAEAVACWRQWQPHLILMDLLMPNTDGREATRIIRLAEQYGQHPTTRIIALTAEPIFSVVHQATATGFDSIIAKPIRPDLILKQIAHHLDLREQPDPAISMKRS